MTRVVDTVVVDDDELEAYLRPRDDGPELPTDGVPYLPCSVDVLLRMVDQAPVGASDVFVDVGAGVGRAATLVHLLTGAAVIGLEVQPALVRAARDLAAGLHLSRVSFFEGDAIELAGHIALGSVFFLYCPFSGDRLTTMLACIEPIARTRAIRVSCVDLPLPPCSWLTRDPQLSGDLTIYRSTLREQPGLGEPVFDQEPKDRTVEQSGVVCDQRGVMHEGDARDGQIEVGLRASRPT